MRKTRADHFAELMGALLMILILIAGGFAVAGVWKWFLQ